MLSRRNRLITVAGLGSYEDLFMLVASLRAAQTHLYILYIRVETYALAISPPVFLIQWPDRSLSRPGVDLLHLVRRTTTQLLSALASTTSTGRVMAIHVD